MKTLEMAAATDYVEEMIADMVQTPDVAVADDGFVEIAKTIGIDVKAAHELMTDTFAADPYNSLVRETKKLGELYPGRSLALDSPFSTTSPGYEWITRDREGTAVDTAYQVQAGRVVLETTLRGQLSEPAKVVAEHGKVAITEGRRWYRGGYHDVVHTVGEDERADVLFRPVMSSILFAVHEVKMNRNAEQREAFDQISLDMLKQRRLTQALAHQKAILL